MLSQATNWSLLPLKDNMIQLNFLYVQVECRLYTPDTQTLKNRIKKQLHIDNNHVQTCINEFLRVNKNKIPTSFLLHSLNNKFVWFGTFVRLKNKDT